MSLLYRYIVFEAQQLGLYFHVHVQASVLMVVRVCCAERPGLTQPQLVEECAERYLYTLVSYERWRRPRKEHFLAKLLQKLTDLRSLSREHARLLCSLKVEKGSLPPLLSEYFDVV